MILLWLKKRTKVAIVVTMIIGLAIVFSRRDSLPVNADLKEARTQKNVLHQQQPQQPQHQQQHQQQQKLLPTPSNDVLEFPSLRPDQKVEMRMDLPDTKHTWPWGEDRFGTLEKCKAKKYDHSKLKPASVIICFHESERTEFLLHTVHTVVQNSPPDLLGEIILVDDNSHNELHNDYLPKYVAAMFGDKVRVIRHRGNQSLGVIAARILGISKARSPNIITLDAHMEAREGWLEPLLYEISQDRRTLASISLDWLKAQPNRKWIYEHGPSDAIAAWFWQRFAFSLWIQDSPENTKRLKTDPTQAFLNPCTIGHWAMDRSFFYEIGGLDPGMQLWGGENIDIAIRTYLWNGRVLGIPCSHVAHIEDSVQTGYRYKEGLGKLTDNNYKRIVEVWLDDWKDTYYYYNPQIKIADAGDLTERMKLKTRCPNTFKTYMEKGFPQMKNTYDPNNIARGGLMCAAYSDRTMYWSNPWTYGMRGKYPLHENQEIFLTKDGFLYYDLAVYNAEKDAEHGAKFTSHTTFVTGNDTRWIHRKGSVIRSYEHDEYCMKCGKELITMEPCNETDEHQRWNFNDYTHNYMDLQAGKLKGSEYLEKYNRYLNSNQ